MKTKTAIWIYINEWFWIEDDGKRKHIQLFKKSYIEINDFNGEINFIEEKNINNQEFLLYDGVTWRKKKRSDFFASLRQYIKETDDPFIVLNNLDDDALEKLYPKEYNDPEREYPEREYLGDYEGEGLQRVKNRHKDEYKNKNNDYIKKYLVIAIIIFFGFFFCVINFIYN